MNAIKVRQAPMIRYRISSTDAFVEEKNLVRQCRNQTSTTFALGGDATDLPLRRCFHLARTDADASAEHVPVGVGHDSGKYL
jgi:hypothetical protein